MRKSLILEKLARDEPSWCVTLHLTDPSLFEMVSMLGVDGIWMDLEHHGYSVEMASNLMRATRVGDVDIIARPAKGEFMRMGRLLEMGATGIMYPRCDNPKEAAEVVRWAKFSPLGQRGIDGANPDMPFCFMPIEEYIREANEQTFIIAQLEQQHALEQAEAILAVPGISMIMLGPGDFSVLSGIPGNLDHPKIQTAIEQVAVAARNTGKHWACLARTLVHAEQYLKMGCRLIFHGSDLLLVKASIERLRNDFEAAGVRLRPPRRANGLADISPMD